MALHLVTGDDDALVLAAVGELVRGLVGDGDRSLMVDDLDGDEFTVGAIVDAAQTPSLLTDRRVVVARGIGRFTADDVAPLVAYVADPLDTTDLVLVGGGGRIPKSLTDALREAGATIHATSPGRGRELTAWFDDQVRQSGLRLEQSAVQTVVAWLGEDVGRLPGILDTLRSVYGDSKVLHSADVTPFLGEAGGVPPWELTDAIDRGDATAALRLLHRMLGGGERHPLQVMSVLHGHYGRLLALDGAGAHDESSAAAAMGIKAGYPARKALEQYRRLGGGAVGRAIGLLADADLDLRGAKDWPEELVMEVLVARLARLGGGAVSRR